MTKVVLITGASRGIGRAAAICCGSKGWSVGVNYLQNAAAAQSAAAAVETAGGRALPIRADVSIEADVVSMFEQMTRAFGRIDGFVNNAGAIETASRLADMSEARLRRVFTINVLGAFLCAREAVRLMSTSRGGRGGSIVNISSAGSRLGGAGEYVDYAASKGAVDSMTIGMSKELGPEGIRVNAIRPGLIDTYIHASTGNPTRAHDLGPSTPLGRAGTAQEVGAAIVWLLSDESSYVSGAILDVAGGR
ncbi:MAG TPA: SDR family oxidoreductase [Beijerinckiaceae bacterium]|nr:SDR family oxidoreductase [Beijerinckiaceae bacterium]